MKSKKAILKKVLMALVRIGAAMVMVPFILLMWVLVYGLSPKRFTIILCRTADHYAKRHLLEKDQLMYKNYGRYSEN